MGFLRQNVFLVAIIGAVVVVGGIFLAMWLSAAGDVEDLIDKRLKLSNELRALALDRRKVNPAVVKAEKDRVEGLRAAAANVARLNVQWNREPYKVLQLKYDDAGRSRTVPAFPIDRKKYADFGLIFQFAEQYRQEMATMLAGLKPTRVPTDQEIATEELRWREDLQRRQEDEERKRRREAALLTDADQPTAPSPPVGGIGTFRGAANRSMRVGGDVAAAARAEALRSARVQKARDGLIYASAESFDTVFSGGEVIASDTELWQAQLNLWVTRDIVEAIKRTNEQVLARIPEKKRNVVTSAVKRLVSVKVSETYYTSGKKAGGFGGAPTGGRPPTWGPGKMPPGYMPPPTMAPDETYVPPPVGGYGRPTPSRQQPRRTPIGESAGTLSERGSTKTYDVIHYEFTVIMPWRHLELLQQNLLKRNLHTVLNVGIDPPGAAAPGGASTGRTSAEQRYYYGSEPVVQVTIMGELLLLTSWERGAWDDKANDWSKEFPALMPVEVLAALSNQDATAIRPEDQRRLVGQTTVRRPR